jgi:hypothetical protein
VLMLMTALYEGVSGQATIKSGARMEDTGATMTPAKHDAERRPAAHEFDIIKPGKLCPANGYWVPENHPSIGVYFGKGTIMQAYDGNNALTWSGPHRKPPFC